jgi:alanyl aminopeptidase
MSIPGRVVTARGKKHLAEEAVRVTPPLLSALEEYFAQPYPYEKLDLIAVPEFWFGAMENVGLIVYKENLLLLDPQIASISEKRRLASVTAHELAHMWFGNLVTMEWWDDIWLNESFASWMDTKITAMVFPQYKVELDVHNSTSRAMKIDSRPSTRAVRRPVLASDNLMQIFDALSYSKGEAVLTMFERWLGEERFRTGVNDYLRANLWGNAAAAEFWAALTKATGVDVNANIAPFLDQGGVPLVDMEYTGDGQAIFTQSRFANYGVNPPSPTVWPIPLQIRFSDGVAVQTKTVLLKEASQVVDLPTERDLAWVYPNDGAVGYYRWKVPPEMLAEMAAQSLKIMETGERISFLHNLAALLDGGYLKGDDYLKMLGYFAKDPDPDVISALIAGLDKVKYSVITPDVEDAFAVYVRQTLGPSLKRFGLKKTNSEDETVSMFRPELIDWLADEGKDEDVLKYAVSLAEKYNNDPASIDPQLIETVVYLSALYGDRELFDDYRQRFETAEVPSVRSRYLSALGSFRDPEIVQAALAYVFEGPLRPHELETIPVQICEYQPYRDRVYQWVIDNYDWWRSRIPAVNAADMPYWAEGCSADRLAEARAFFSQPEHSPPGTEESMAKVSDIVGDCVSLRDREGDAVAVYLRQVAAR